MEDSKNIKQIDFVEIFHSAKRHWKLYPIWIAAAFAVACIVILPVPRYYRSTVMLAPETDNTISGSSLGSLASQFGISLGSSAMESNDAIVPDFYPDVVSSTDFQTSLFSVPITTKDNEVKTNYYDYLSTKQKACWWQKAFMAIKRVFMSKKTKAEYGKANDNVNPFWLTRRQTDICKKIGNNIKCEIDRKTSAISITVEDQDPLIAAVIADTVKSHLQQFITEYRTQKSRQNLNYVIALQKKAKQSYEKARREYAAYSDANQDAVLQEYQSKIEDLENEMQLRYNSYSAISTQVEAARARLAEQTPAFTTLQSATVPAKPAGPKRMIFTGVCMIIAFIIVTVYAMAKDNEVKKRTE